MGFRGRNYRGEADRPQPGQSFGLHVIARLLVFRVGLELEGVTDMEPPPAQASEHPDPGSPLQFTSAVYLPFSGKVGVMKEVSLVAPYLGVQVSPPWRGRDAPAETTLLGPFFGVEFFQPKRTERGKGKSYIGGLLFVEGGWLVGDLPAPSLRFGGGFVFGPWI